MTTTYSELNTINDSLNNIKTALISKNLTPSGNITTYATAINNYQIPVGINREVINGVYKMPTTSFTFSLPSNATDVGSYALSSAFRGCTGLTSVDLSSLTTISGSSAFDYTFYGCTGLTSVNLSSLTTISSSQSLANAFYGCTQLTTLSFPALTSTSFGSYTNQFNSMLYGVTGCTVHFPSNLQSVIGSWSSVTSGFGGTNTTVLFDLPATT